MQKKNKRLGNQGGITLIALIITIIVMLILVTVTVRVAIDTNLFGHAKNAIDKYSDSEKNDADAINGYVKEIEKYNTEEDV